MYSPINFLEIIRDYWKHMKEDFKTAPLLITLVLVPALLASLFLFLVKNEKAFYNSLIYISAILAPLLLNFLMIIYYSLERTEKTDKRQTEKIEYLEHVNSTISMATLTSIFILILSLILSNINCLSSDNISMPIKLESFILLILKLLLSYMLGFMIVNVVMSLVRIYRLIRYEIREIKKEC